MSWAAPSGFPVSESDGIAENIVAGFDVDGRPVAPALAAKFAGHGRFPRLHGPDQHVAQIEIAADTLMVVAGDAKDRPRAFEVDGVFDLAAARESSGVVITQVDRRRIQLGKFFREPGRSLHPQIFLAE